MPVNITQTQFDSGTLGTVEMKIEQHENQAEIRDMLRQQLIDAGEDPSLLLNSVLREAQVRDTDEGVEVEQLDAVLGRLRSGDDTWFLFAKPSYPGSFAPETKQAAAEPDHYNEARGRALSQFGWMPLEGLSGENRLAQARTNEKAEARFKETVGGLVPPANRLSTGGGLPSQALDHPTPQELLSAARHVDGLNGRASGPTGAEYPSGPSSSENPIYRLADARRAEANA